jgi:RNA polymerase sigma factor (sigma-70 family)
VPDFTPLPSPLVLALIAQGDALLAYVDRQLPPSLRGSVDPADVVQDVFAEALRRESTYDPSIDPSGRRWLFTIAKRRIIRLMERHHAGRQRTEAAMAKARSDSIDLLEQLAVYERTPSQSAVGRESVAAVQRALAELTPDHAAVIRSRYVERLSAAAVAERIGRTPAAVDKLLQRAMTALAAKLGLCRGAKR